MAKSKAIFIDKDGTLIPDIPYNVNPDLVSLENGVGQGLEKLQAAGYLTIIISNQAGVARGFFTEDQLIPVRNKVTALLKEVGVFLQEFYYCPHHPQGIIEGYSKQCTCRKPLPGMITQAANDHDIDLSCSWMIGDILNDVEAGNRAGCKTVLINNGNETEWIHGEYRQPLFMAKNFLIASDFILNQINGEI